uniref:Putative HYR domain protein n=1 Tax=uncultured marine crenarchaeote HF4000_ANIW97P9 TaxID=455569 RepID=B3T3H1_9ARCH|nr:putative HYR domain protein [uncultured marine crenarchaeote HF4000_ANIW97P9]
MLFVPPSIPFMVPEADAQSNDTGGTTPDITAPTVNAPYNITNSTTNSAGGIGSFTVTASDNYGVTSGPTCSPPSGSNFPVGTTTVTCTATDAAGNVGTASFVVTITHIVIDTTLPTITVPSNITNSTSNSAGGFITFYVTASDDVGVTSGPTCSPSSTSFFPVGTTTVTCTATDDAGNTGTVTFTVTVNYTAPADTTPSVNLSFESLDITTSGGGTTLSPGETWYITPTLTWEGVVFASGSYQGSFPTGEPVVHGEIKLPDGTVYESINWTDIFGNSANSVDYNAKTITLSTFNRQLYTTSNWPVGQYTVTITADTGNFFSETNESDNVITGTFYVASESTGDTTPPVIHIPSCGWLIFACSKTIVATNSAGFEYSWSVHATDNVDVISVNCSSDYPPIDNQLTSTTATPSGMYGQNWGPFNDFLFPLGTTLITCQAYDAAGNTSSASITITITDIPDTTPPVITINGLPLPSTLFFSTSSSSGLIAIFDYTWSDNIGVIGETCYPWPGSLFPVGSTTVTCTASDAAGNIATVTFTVTVNYTGTQGVNYTVYVNQMRGSGVIDANDPGGCAGLTPQTCYSPSSVTINIGDSVTWINKDTTNNWYTLMGTWGGLAPPGGDNACDGPGKLNWDMCGISGNDRTSWTHTFDQMGSYYYHDWVYQNSAQRPEGAVYVLSGNAPTTSSQLPVITTQTSADVTPTVIATAYLNGTSPTGRTFYMYGTDVGPALEHYGNSVSWTPNTAYFTATISSDATNSVVWPTSQYMSEISFRKSIEYNSTWPPGIENGWQTPIPTDWVAGTYTVAWEGGPNFDWSGSISVTVPALPGTDAAEEEEIIIPAWIKSNAGWWDAGLIDNRNYVTGLQWLISNGIMTIPPTEQGTGSDDVIPSWVKNNARWWADGSIDDRNYVTGLQWLISNGVMTIG